MAFKLTVTCVLFALFTVPASPGTSHSGPWSWDEWLAFTRFSNGIAIGISFIPGSNCDKALLLISGNDAISRISLDVDLTTFAPIDVTRTADAVYIELTQSQLKLLKSGSNAALITDQGILTMTLNGSAKAINGAWSNCKMIAETGLQRTPRQQADASSTATGQKGPAGKLFHVDEDNVLAFGNVIFIFNRIDNDDAGIVERIVRDMRGQDIHLRSIVFYGNYGGSLGAAMDLGEFIRSIGANTAAADVCASACIYAFSGGLQRTSYINTRFGLHQTRYGDGDSGTMSEGQEIAAARYGYLERMGVNPKIAIWESEVKPDSMRWISQYEAKGLNLANLIIEDYELPSGIGRSE